MLAPVIPGSVFDQLRQELWDIQGAASNCGALINIFTILRSRVHVQVQFQKKESWAFIRWPALIARLEPNHLTRQQFRQVMLMEPETFIDLCWAAYAAVNDGKSLIALSFFETLRPHYGQSIDLFLSLFVRDISTLRNELQLPAARSVSGRIELFEFPYLQRFPFLRLQNGQLACWHPLVFARGMEDAIHLRLSELGQSYTDPFSKVFESYVLENLSSTGLEFTDESQFKAIAGKQSFAVEAIVQCNGCNVFIEAKMSLFWDHVLLEDDPVTVFNKTKRVREAINQAWRTSALLRSGSITIDDCAKMPEDFLLVVTSRQLNIGGGEMLMRIYPEKAFENIYPENKTIPVTECDKKYLPLANIFVLSIEDFEQLSNCIAAGEVELEQLLRKAASLNRDLQTSAMYFSDFLKNNKKTRRFSKLIEDASTVSEARLIDFFDKNERQRRVE